MVTGAVSEAAGDSLSGIENVTGTVHGDSLTGNASENVLTGGYGDDTLIGGDGADVVNYDGNFAAYDVVYDSAEGTFTVTDKSSVHGDDGTDTLSGIETVVFEADGVAIDLTKAPIAYGAKARVDTGGEITWTLKTVASDLADGTDNSLTYALEEGPAHGHAIIHANGRYTYLADAGYDGFDSFTYRVTDSRGLSSVATIDMGVGTAPAGGGGALDFNGTDAHLSWTRAAAGDSKTWTYSFWARGDITSGSSQKVLSAGPDGDNRFEIYFNNSQIGLYQKTGTTVELDTVTTAIDNTPDEWVHYVVAVDTTADTESGRVSVYRNGAALGFDPDYAATFIAKDTETFVNGAQTHRIGVQYDNTDQRFRGGLADVALVEGQALAAASFAAHDATDGWRSKDLSGLDFGTGGVYLDFAEATDVGRDVSGNGIAITLNGVTAGNWSVDGPPTAALDGDDAFVGGLGDDSIRGDAGDDLLIGGEGNDTLDGGSGRDTVRYNGARADYDVVYDSAEGTFTVTDKSSVHGDDGTDTLSGIETVVFEADGGFVVAWDSYEAATGSREIFTRRFDADGTALGGASRVNADTAGDQHYPNVTVLADGKFVIVWETITAATHGHNHFGQLYGADGTATGSAFQINTTPSSSVLSSWVPRTTALADGGFVVTWYAYQDGSSYGIYARRYGADGSPTTGEFLVNTTTTGGQYSPEVAALSDGGYVIAWQSKLQDGSEYGIYGQRYDASGTAVGSEFAVNTTTAGNQDNPRISALADGGFVVTWASDGQDGDARGVYARRYDADGNPVGPEVLPTVGNDSIEGTAEADVLDGLAGDDLLIGGEGNDTLSGGAGVDTASYAGSEDDYDIVYDGGTGLLTVTDTNAADGDSGTDTLSGVESLTFDQGTADTSDDMTVDLTGSLPAATDGALQIGEGGSASWTLTGPVGDGLSYALEGDTDEDGEITTAGGGTVTLTDAAKGEYTYQAGVGQKGADSFQFRVTDSATGVSSVATVDVGVGSVGYTVDNALSLNGTDEYLSWTPGTAGDSKSWTVSLWLKPSALVSPENLIYQAGNDGNNRTYMAFTSTGQLRMMTDVGAQRKVDLITTDSFVDPNKWQHVVFFYDSTVASPGSSNVGIIVDGQQVTAFDTEVYPPQNTESYVNGAVNHYVGRNHFTSHFDGSLAEVVQVDGQALDASAFGEFDADGTWVPVDVLPSNWPVLGTDVLAGTETVTVSDTASSDGPEVVYDDDTSAQWQSANGTSGKYWQVDLGAGQEQAVERVNFMSANDMNGDSAHNITSLQVKGSVDGSTWVTLADVNPSSWALNQMHAIDFSNDTAYRHYRLEKAAGGASGGLNLKEVELLARDATATDFGTNGFHLDFADGTAQAAVDFIDAGATITASSGQWDSGGNALVNMIDGDAGTYWHSASQGTSHTVTLSDFGAAKRPSQYRIHFQDDNANSGLSFTQIQFEGWNGSSWQVIDTQTSGFDWTDYSWYEVDVNASEAYEQVRWTFTKSLNYYMHSLMEFEVLYEPSGLGLDASGNGNDFDVTNLDETNLSPDTPTSGQFEGVAPTEGNDSIEGTIEADVIDGLSGDDQLIGNEGADTLSGGSGDDLLIGGEGDDTLSGGSGVDTARYAGAQTDYDVLYDGATGLVTVADLEETLHGNDGTDTLSGIETLTFDQGTADTADDVTIDVSGVLPVATDSAVQIQVDGSASWTLTGPVGDGLSYSLEGDTDADGTITTANGGTVTLTDAAKGEYTYQAGAGQTGADSFQFRVTDATGVSSTATVDVGVGSVGYTVDNALSLNGTDEYLSWTPGTGGDGRTFTISSWVKRGAVNGLSQFLATAGPAGSDYFELSFSAVGPESLRLANFTGGGTDWDLRTNQTFSGTSEWMHIVAAVDTTQATAADRIKLYVDGTEITSFSSATYPSQDFAGSHWTSGEAHHIGNFKGVSDHFDGQMAEFVSVDGQALDASSFGQDDGSGNWVPVDVSGLDHGANGFHLDFADANNLGADVNGATSLAANLVPAMTSATGPEGTVTHSSELSSTYAAYQAFDGAKTVGGNEGAWVSGAAPSGGSPQWLAYEFASSKVVSQYAVTAGTANVATNAPKDWTFEGWDGSAWVTLDTVTAETGWSNSETRSFSFANTTSYQKYRLAVTANNGHSNEVTVGELEIGGQGPLFAAVNIDAADQSLDSPSRNYAVMTDDWAVAATQTMFTVSEGGLRLETSGIGGRFAGSTLMFDAGQWAFEATHTVMSAGRSYRAVGVGSQDWFTDGDFNNNDAFFYQEDGTVWDGSAWVAYGAAWGVNDVIRTEVDYANGTIEWFKNDVSQGRLNVSFNPISYAAGVYSGGNGSDSITLDFGQHGFTHTPTAGFQALTAQNLDGTTFGDPIVTPTEGHDSIEGTAEADTIDGLSGDDQLIGNEGADILYGVSGDDRLLGGDGADRLYGGAGDDVLAGGSGDDRLLGGEGSDTADFGDAASAVTADLSQANAGGEVTATIGAETDTLVSIENLVGSDHGDTLTGDDGANDLSGGGGADTLAGGAGDDTLSGGADGDSLVGGEGVDTVSYQDSDSAVTIDLQADTAAGGHAAGDELDGIENLIGSGHGDVLTGDGNANDLAGGGGADTVSGGDGDDTLSGGDDDDVMAGDAGHDVLSGGGGSDSLDGGAGDDILAGGAGNDELIGGEGLDTADYLDAQADVSVDLSQTTVTATVGADHDTLSGIENVIGSAHGDTLTGDGGANVFDGNAGADIVEGGDGDDTVSGGADDDTVSGGDGVDTLTGGDGADLLFGDAGDDDLDGGLGDDVLTGGAGADTLDGGLGVNTVSYLGSDSAVTVDLSDYSAAGGHAEGDVLVTSTIHNLDGSRHGDTLTGDDGVNVLTGNAGTDTLVGGLGDDTLAGGSGGDTLDGGDGSDTASYEGSWSGVSVNLSTGQGSGGHAQGDALSNIENVEGSDFDDALTGDAGVNTLSGGDGDDVLAGGAGGDRLIGGLGSDTAGYQDSDSAVTIDLQADTAAGGHATGDDLDGIENLIGSDHADTLTGDGNDNVLTGGAGGDTLTGGLGSDTVSYSGSDAGVTVDLLSDTATGGHASGDDLDGIENLTGSGHDDTLTGDGGDNILAGGAGNDVLTGGAGIDAADYQDSQGAVTVDLSQTDGSGNVTASVGSDEQDVLNGIEDVIGSAYGDLLTGDDGVNVLDGGSGSDTLTGGAGGDILSGGSGDDVAVYSGDYGDYTITGDDTSATVTDTNAADGDDGADSLDGVEHLQFADRTIHLDGTNNAVDAFGDGNAINEDVTVPVTGNVLDNDDDFDDDALNVTSVNGDTANVGQALSGLYGDVTIHADGTYSYALDNTKTAIQALADGVTVTDTFTYDVADGFGGTDQATLTITITGTNDVPVIGGVTTGDVTEDGTLTASGLLTISDADAGQSVFQAATNVAGSYGILDILADGNWTYSLTNTDPAVQGLAAGATLTDTITVYSADGNWTYSLDNTDPAVQGLAAGATLTDTIAVQSFDGTSQDIVVTITGTNDVPVIGGVSTGDVTEDGTLTASGLLTITDADTGQSTFQAATNVAGSYGSLDILADGNWTYSLTNTDPAVQGLAAGATLTDTITVYSADGTSQDIVVTITGTNDAPVIGGVATGDVTEDGTLTASGLLTITDADTDQSEFQPATNVAGSYGSLDILADGNWTYSLDNANAAVQGLAAGATMTDTITVYSADGTSQDIVVTITGTNDVPVIGGVSTGDVTEDGTLTASGLLTITDADTGQSTFQAATNVAGSYGDLDILADGNWTYSLTNTDPAVQGLAAGATLTDTITVYSADGTSQDIVVTITGTNDGPVAVADAASVAEDTLPNPISGNLLTNDTDVDGDSLIVSAVTGGTVGQAIAGSFGSVIINGDGGYVYTLDNTNSAVQALGVGASLTETFTYEVSDGNGGTDQAALTITIDGTNDAPVIGGISTGDVTEDGTLTASGLLTISDVDTDESAFQAATGIAGNYGSLDILANGNWAYSLDNADPAVQGLAAGTTLSDVVTVHSVDGTGQDIVVTITGTNDGPIVVNPTAGSSVDEDTSEGIGGPASFYVLGGVSDPDGDALTVTAVSETSSTGVALTVTPTGFSLDTGFFNYLKVDETETVTLEYTVSDGVETTTAPFTLTITGSNDGPVATANDAATNAGVPVTVAATDLLADDTDIDGDTLSIDFVGNPVNGTVAFDGSGDVVFTPTAGYSGPASFDYTVTDNNGGSDTATVSVIVEPALIATDSAAQLSTDGSVDWKLTGSGGSEALTYSIEGLTASTDGSHLAVDGWYETAMGNFVRVTDAATGDYEYDAVNGYEGADSFDFRVTDSATGVSSTATVDVGVGFPGYAIDNSISLDGSSESLSMTPTSAGNQKTWTWSGWVKPASVGANNVIWSVGSVGRAEIMFNPSGQLFASFDNSNSTQLVTSASFADSTKWTHVAFAVDTTQGAASERLKLYIDGTEVSSFSQANYPGQDAVGNVNSSLEHRVGYDLGTYFDGSVAETALVDGLALDASSFGKFDGSGNWVPKDVSGLTYGTNGFHLDFADGADLGNDVSGNNRDFAGTNIDASDQSFDSPTDNFVTLDPSFSGGLTLSDGNLVARSDGVTSRAVGTTAIPLDATGQYCFAGEITGQGSGSHSFYIGIQAASGEGAGGTNQLWYRAETGEIQDEAATWTSYGSSFTVGDEVGVLVDMDADTVTFYKNGVSQGVAFDNISTRLSSAFLPKFKTNNISGDEWTAKFGAQGYKYPAPVGAKTLSSAEMSDAYVGNPIVTPTSGNDSIEGTAEADTNDGLAGDDQLIGNAGADTLSGGSGDDLLIGGEGDDTLAGGAGNDTASFSDDISGYTVSYDSATDTITVTDTDTDTSNGDDGSDTITGVESFDFNGTTLTKADLEAAPTATDSAAQLSKDGVVDWTLTGSGGTGTLSYVVENGGAAIDTTVATGLGFDTLDGDVFATTNGHVQVKADGGYAYRPDAGYEGADSFDFRVTDDSTGVSSTATVDVGVGFPGYEIANSVNLNGTDEYLSFTPSSGDPSTRFTFSGWVKRNSLGEQIIISSGDNSSERAAIKFTSVENGNKLQMHADSAAQGQYLQLQSDIAIDTVGEWVHIYVAIDSTQAVAADRVVMAVNGTQVGYSQETWFGQNTTMQWGNAVAHHIGDQSYDGIYKLDAGIADFVVVNDAIAPIESFAETNGGTWVPVEVLPSSWQVLGTDVLAGTETVTVSDTTSSDGPEVVYDNDTSAQWQSANGTSGKYWQVDLGSGQEQAVERVNLMSANDMNGDSAHNITSLQVKGSVDGSTWVTLADVDPSSWALNQMHAIDFSNDTAYRHYRLEKAAGGASGGLNLKEVELLARNATATDFGTNGFHLDFADGADLGNDVGSNNNDFTTTNLDATDQTLDSPTRNFATFDAADGHSDIVLSGGNLIVDSTSAYGHNRAIKASTSVSTGKYYWEVKIANGAINGSRSIGIIDATHSLTGSTDYLGGLSNAIALDASQGTVRSSGTPIAYLGTSLSVGDVVGVVVDMDAQKLWFSVNGSYVNNGDPETGANPVDTASLGFTWPASIAPAASTQSTRELHFNFGATDLLYKPAGFGTLESVTIEGTTFGDPIETPTEGNDSIEGTLEADVIDGLGGDDKLIGNGGVDTLSGNDGDDLLIGGEGDDTLSGGAGDDTASYADNISGYTVSYDSATDTITVTDTDTSNGDEGTDTITGVESFDFNGTTLTKADLEAAPIATDSAAQVATDGVADWTLTGSGGSGTLTYAIEGLAASTDGAHLAANGWYETAMGNFVRVTDAATGDYEYDAVNGYEGADSFDFRVTDDATGVSSVATVDVGVGFPGYAIEHSVSFDAAEGESLSRTPAGAGDRKAWTYSFWLKGDVSGSTSQKVLSVGPDSSNRFNVYFADNKMGVYQQASGSTQLDAVSDTLPDNSNGTAWHHYVVSVDTAAATGAERVRIYKDENLVGFDSGYPNTYIGQNVDTFVNGTEKHRIGVQYDDTNQHLDSDLAEVVLIDGQALDALAFGEFDANGDWVAKAVDPSTWMAPEDVTSSVDAVNTSASMSDPDSDVAHLTDGNATTKWSSLNGSSGQYFEFDFGAGDERAIEQIYIDFRQDNSSGYLDSLDIKASNDGVTYTTVSTVTNPGWAEGENVTLEFANSTAYRYWRVEKASGASNTNLNIYEAKMYVMGPATDLGTNGFHLDFADGANLGDDAAGSNDFTTTNLDATDQTLDSPTDNYATLDPNGVLLGSGGTLSDGNLSWEGGWTGTQEVVGTIAIPSSGSFYMEGRITTAGSTPRSTYFGFLDADRGPNFSHGILSRADTAALSGSVKVLDGAESTDGPYASWRSTDVDIGMLYDVDNDVVKAYVDGVLQWTQENASTYLTGNTILPYVVGGDGTVFTVDFGQNGFNETIPAGATPLSSAHIDGTTYGEPLVTPTSGNDSIEGTSDADVIDGLAGDDKLIGNEGGDTLTGNEGDDQLIGNAGDDTLSDGSGDDTYSFGRGDDADLIDNIGEGASADTVKFGATIDTDQLWFRQDGNDLVVDVIGTADSVTIDEWYASADNRVDTFETADGSTLDDANVQNLVSAMASFSPPALGETELSQALHDSLDPVIAANWQSGGS